MILRYCRALRLLSSAVRQYHTISNERSLQLLSSYGIPIAKSLPAYTPDEAATLTSEFSSASFLSEGDSFVSRYVQKPPAILTPVSSTIPPNTPATYSRDNLRYGRHAVYMQSEARTIAATMLGKEAVLSYGRAPKTKKEADERVPFEDDGEVKKLLVSRFQDVAKMFMLSIMVDRKLCCPVLLVSRRAVLHMEKHLDDSRSKHVARFKLPYVGAEQPAIPSEVMLGVRDFLRLDDEETEGLWPHVQAAYNFFRNREAILVEINPFAITKAGKYLAIDARIVADSSALFRQTMLKPPPSPPLPPELAQKASEMAYVTLPNPTATIGTIVNGAGLAMATNDALKLYGGEAANFCDFGGRATAETILEAFKKVLADQRVNTILVNVYGGITQCDMIAQAILDAVGAATNKADVVPVVVRLAGTGAKQGMERIRKSPMALYTESTFEAAAKKAIELSKQGEGKLVKQKATKIRWYIPNKTHVL